MTEHPFDLQLFAEEAAPGAETAPDETGRKAALYDAFAPSIQALARRYGVEAEPKALEEAMHTEEQALLQHRQAQAGRLYDAWMDQAEQTKQAYPDFDLAKEMGDPRFLGLLQARVDVCTAYEALHRRQAMERTAREVEENLLGRLSHTGLRPQENGTAAQSPAVTRQDVARMSRSDRQAIIRRVQQGERITL